TEKHFTSGDTVRDIVIGMSDGLTVPFALAAGLSGAVDSTTVIITAGLAEIAAGSIAMGLGGYLAARSDAEHDARERVRERAGGAGGTRAVGRLGPPGARGVRLRQGALHRHDSGAQRLPDHADRRLGGRRGLPHRPLDRLTGGTMEIDERSLEDLRRLDPRK